MPYRPLCKSVLAFVLFILAVWTWAGATSAWSRSPGQDQLKALLQTRQAAGDQTPDQGTEYVLPLTMEPGLPEVLELNLTEAVHLALRRNREIESAYLGRILQKFSLGRDLSKFHPNLKIEPKADASIVGSSSRYVAGGPDAERSRTETVDAGVVTTVTQKVPTGAELSFAWDNTFTGTRNRYGDIGSRETGLTGWSVGFRQPLLRSGGIRYNTASLVRAAMQEEDDVRALRDTLIGTVNGVITDYRAMMRARQRLELAEDALAKANKHLEDTRVLIAAGRRAANESLQAEADLAQKELDLETARQELDTAQLNLVRRLELDSGTAIALTEPIELHVVTPDFENSLKLALERNQAFLSAHNALELARMNLEDVLNQRRWDLDLEGAYTDGWRRRHPEPDFRQDEWRVGVALKIPLPIYGDPKYDREQPLLAARIALRRAEMALVTNRENLENLVRQRVLTVESRLKQVELARRTYELSEQTYHFSELKYQLGQMSNTSFIIEQDRLRNARNSLNDSIINYQNSLTELDALLATTLDTWGIAFIAERADLEEQYLGGKVWLLDR
ncbi:Outer membrane protein TolC [Desulfonatronum thiosulfatophilum]|uniref:Outer membrane protein TolC n=1 Tax=Desulfonatronum thiosulfatophilum TaxID=617002 RepID=A0A1G6C635_9BACT|nr:TolC family protein [Desulfonatronum thiosulfatophilum]SDB28366.1 Outer membrane protein TolC [Desulfonatronum thiosulfatophilum]